MIFTHGSVAQGQERIIESYDSNRKITPNKSWITPPTDRTKYTLAANMPKMANVAQAFGDDFDDGDTKCCVSPTNRCAVNPYGLCATPVHMK